MLRSTLAVAGFLGLLALPAAGHAQACKQTIDLTPMGGQKMVQCHEVTDMPSTMVDGMCRPTGNAQVQSVPEKLQKCPANYTGICSTPLRTAQANINRMQGRPGDDVGNIPEKATIKAYFYEGMPPNVAEQCSRSGGTWTAAKAPAKAPAKKQQ